MYFCQIKIVLAEICIATFNLIYKYSICETYIKERDNI